MQTEFVPLSAVTLLDEMRRRHPGATRVRSGPRPECLVEDCFERGMGATQPINDGASPVEVLTPPLQAPIARRGARYIA